MTARPHNRPDLAIKCNQADTVLLVKNQIGQRRGEAFRIFQLRKRGTIALKLHALASVEQEITNQIGLLLVLLQVVLVGLAKDFPIDIPEIVAGDIFPVLGKLNGKAMIRTAMCPGHKSFDDDACPEFQSIELSQHSRI
jgi:hypothetical protein